MKYKINLQIAGLQLQLYTNSVAEMEFLMLKFHDFITKRSINHVAQIFICNHKKKPTTRKNNFILSIASIEQDFKFFNDELRKIVSHLLLKNNGLLLHASSVAVNNRGFIFIGDEGMGKSTIRKILNTYQSLGDDSALIRVIKKKVYLFGSPFYQTTNRPYPNRKVLIKGIFNLNQSKINRIELLTRENFFKRLISNSFISGLACKHETETLFNRVLSISALTAGFDLYFKQNPSFWNLIQIALKTNLKNKSIKKAVSRINPKVRRVLSKSITWGPTVAEWEILIYMRVINETSWNFEFGGKRKVSDIAEEILTNKTNSSHRELIKEKKQILLKGNEEWLIAVFSNHKFCLVDGNHTAVALFLLGKEGIKLPIRLILGRKN